MSGSSSARRQPESIGDFMKRRFLETMPEGAVATAHDLYGKAIRLGHDLDLPTPRDVADFGAKVLRGPGAQPGASRPARHSLPRSTSAAVAPPRSSNLEQIWNGTPEAMKTTIAGARGGVRGLDHSATDEERRW